MLDVFMDVAERAVFDLDARIAGALRFAQAHGVAVGAGWHAGVALVREDPVVTEILLHYLRDRRALEQFDLGSEPHYEGSQQRGDLLLTSKSTAERHLIEVKWWWWNKDEAAVCRDAAKLRDARGESGDIATGHLLIVTSGNEPADWRDEHRRPAPRPVLEWFEKNAIRGIWQESLGKPLVRVFPTNATLKKNAPSEEFVGALILVPVADRVRVAKTPVV